ncbi:MAG: peptidylprolyl isomerase, partial [Methylobacter sp.]
LALGLDDDLVIQRLLREKMRMLLRQDPNGIQIRDQDVADYVERHRDQFLQPDTVSFAHAFLSGQPEDGRLLEKAKVQLAKLRIQSTPPETAVKHSDAFLLGQQFQAQTLTQVTRHFGENFADAVFSLAPRLWSGPIASPYGLHLIWVEKKDSGTMPPLQAIWKQAAQGLLEERSAASLAIGLQRLREFYKIRIEEDQPGTAQAVSTGGNS